MERTLLFKSKGTKTFWFEAGGNKVVDSINESADEVMRNSRANEDGQRS